MTTKFDSERHHVELLLRRLDFAFQDLNDPNLGARSESGADVLAVIAGKRIGVQVAVLDPNQTPGPARAAEKELVRAVGAKPYLAWVKTIPRS